MADTFTYDVFLSHSAKDKAVVRSIAERLRADGLRVWLDDCCSPPGPGSRLAGLLARSLADRQLLS